MPILSLPSAAAEREHDRTRRHPERETLELATAGAARVLGPDHGVTKALARASITFASNSATRAVSASTAKAGGKSCPALWPGARLLQILQRPHA